MKLNRSKSWYEKKAKLEGNCSIGAGRFPSEIFDSKPAVARAARKASSVKRIAAKKVPKPRRSS